MTAVPRSSLDFLEIESRRSISDYAALQRYAHFCEDEASLLEQAAAFLRRGYLAGERLLVIVTDAHWKALQCELEFASCDGSRVTVLEAKSTLSSIVHGSALDVERLIGIVGLGNQTALCGYSEMADILWQRGERKTAILLEDLWEDLGRHINCRFRGASVLAGFWKDPEQLASTSEPLVRSALDESAVESCIIERDVAQSEARQVQLVRRFAKEIAHRQAVENVLRESLEALRREVTDARHDAELSQQAQLQSTLDALPVLVSFIDADERYQSVNAAYEQWFGHARSEVLGKHIVDVLGSVAYDRIKTYVSRALAGEIVTYESEVPYRFGGSRYIDATYLPQRTLDGRVVGYVSLVTDITARKNYESARATAAARAEKLLTITAAIANAVTRDEVFVALVDRVADAVNASSVGLWLVDEDAETARMARSYGYKESARAELSVLPIGRDEINPIAESIRSREAIWIPSQAALVERYPRLRSTAGSGRSYRVSSLPLISGSRVLGSLGLTLADERETSEEEREFLLIIAGYASQALERLRLLDAERRSRSEADAAASRSAVLSHAARAFVESHLDIKSRLQTVVDEIGIALASCTAIVLDDTSGARQHLVLHHPIPEASAYWSELAVTSKEHWGEDGTGGVANASKSVMIQGGPEQIAARTAPALQALLEAFPAYAMISVPLRAEGRITGSVTVMRVREGESYSAEHLRLVEELAERAAIALENSRLYEQTREARIRAEQLYRFAQAIVAADGVDTVFDAAITAIETALLAKRSAVLTYATDDVMRFRAWRNLSEHYRRAVEGHSPWPRHATAPEPVLVPDAQCDEALAAYRQLFESEGIGALAFIPLLSRGRLIGKFMFYYDEPHVFLAHELETARSIAAHLASVIARFSVVAELEETIRYNELFAGVLAHDLRNPLGAIMTAAQLVLMRTEGEALAVLSHDKPLSRILSSGRRMTNMIDQLLDFTRARSGGGIGVRPVKTNVAELCAQAIGEFELSQPDWRIRFEWRGDPYGQWDSDRLLQVISNLVANAGQHGSSTSDILVKMDGGANAVVILQVHNDGAIQEGLLEHLFDPFRGTMQRRDSSGGLGLGLFIVREIVHSHHGTVSVASDPANGTTFTVRLPRQHNVT